MSVKIKVISSKPSRVPVAVASSAVARISKLLKPRATAYS